MRAISWIHMYTLDIFSSNKTTILSAITPKKVIVIAQYYQSRKSLKYHCSRSNSRDSDHWLYRRSNFMINKDNNWKELKLRVILKPATNTTINLSTFENYKLEEKNYPALHQDNQMMRAKFCRIFIINVFRRSVRISSVCSSWGTDKSKQWSSMAAEAFSWGRTYGWMRMVAPELTMILQQCLFQ